MNNEDKVCFKYDKADALIALYHETWGEITRLRDYEWKIGYYFTSMSFGVILLFSQKDLKSILSNEIKIIITIIQCLAALFSIYYLEKTHRYLNQQRNFRRQIEEIFEFYDINKYSSDPVLLKDWKGKRISKNFERMGLLIPIMVMVLLIQGFSIFIMWNKKNLTQKGEIHLNKSDVRFRFMSISIKENEIPGICLNYKNEKSARHASRFFHDYNTSTPGSKSVSLKITEKGNQKCTVEIAVMISKRVFNVNIKNVDSCYIKQIKEALKKVPFYVILVGFDKEGKFHLLPPENYHFLKRYLLINDRIVYGNPDCKIDWESLFKPWIEKKNVK